MICVRICKFCRKTEKKRFVPDNLNWKVVNLNKMDEIFERTKKSWIKFIKPAVKVAAPFIGMATCSKTKNSRARQGTANFVKSISGGKTSIITDQHSGNGLRLGVM